MDVSIGNSDSNTGGDVDSFGGRDFSVDSEGQLWAELEDSWDGDQGVSERGR